MRTAGALLAVLTLATMGAGHVIDIYRGGEIEGPGIPRDPYNAICFHNCVAQPGEEFAECFAFAQPADSASGAGTGCVTHCRYRDSDPMIPLPPGDWRGAYNKCAQGHGANCEEYLFADEYGQSDGGCSVEMPAGVEVKAARQALRRAQRRARRAARAVRMGR